MLNPLKVTLTNMSMDEVRFVDAPNFPQDPSRGVHKVTLNRVVYIDRNDFRTEDSKSYYGLAPGKQVGIKYAGYITCTRVITSSSGEVLELEATYAPETTANIKGHIHWVCGATAATAPQVATVRLYSPLFNEEMEMVDGSLEVVEGALVDASLVDAPVYSKYQFERVSVPENAELNIGIVLRIACVAGDCSGGLLRD